MRGKLAMGVTDAAEEQAAGKKKRKIFHGSEPRKPRVVETKPVGLEAMKDAATDLSNPAQLTMREIIKRAEAIERKKLKEEAAKKAASGADKGTAKNNPAVGQDTPTTSTLTPQVEVVNGRIVINQQSLVVGAQASTREDTESYRRVEENRSKLNYNSYANRTPVERWRTEDTELFYKALQQFGTDFELIQNLFPGRTRRQVKAKFKNEEKHNPVRLADVLGHKIQDQSHHYRAIIKMLKPEKGNEEETLLDSLLVPAVNTEELVPEETGGTPSKQKSPADAKAPEPLVKDNAAAPQNIAVTEAVKEDVTNSKEEEIREIVASAPTTASPQPAGASSGSEPVATAPLSKGAPPSPETASPPPAPKPRRNPIFGYRSGAPASGNPLGAYTAKRSPLGMYK